MGILSPILKAKKFAGRVHSWTIAYARVLGSLRVAAVLWVAVILALIWSKILSDLHGYGYAKWHVLHTYWFAGLLIAAAENALCLMGRILLKKQTLGFNILHLGWLLLAGGIAHSFFGSTEGVVSLSRGQAVSQMTKPDSHEIRVNWSDRPQERPYVFTFEPDAVDWLDRKPFTIGEVDGMALRVLRYVRHASPTVDWIADKTERGGPALKVKLSGDHLLGDTEKQLPDEQLGDETFIGPIRLQFQQASCACMLDEFLNPPTELGASGQLVVMYQDQLQRVDVDANLGKRISIAESDIAIEIAEYLPDARPDGMGRFSSRSKDPKNPLLELRVYLPKKSEPRRQLAFAKNPLTNLDAVYGPLPVKFRYYHPNAVPQGGVELLQAVDQRLYARVISGDRFQAVGEVEKDSQIQLPAGFELAITEYLPHALRNIQFVHSQSSPHSLQIDSAALVEITTDGVSEKVWVQRNSPLYGLRIINTPQGPLTLRYGNATSALEFQLALADSNSEANEETKTTAAVVRLVDQAREIDRQQRITSAQPLMHNGFRISLASDADTADPIAPLKLHLSYTAGGRLKRIGAVIMFAGVLAIIASRTFIELSAAGKVG